MPPRRFENRSPEPGSRRWSFLDEEKDKEKKEQPPEKTSETKPKLDEKKPEKPNVKKEESKSEKPKELSPEEKQQRRNQAIEQSQALKNTFEEKPLPNDPSIVARLIVAKQILGIDEQLHDPETFDNEKTKQKLEATLDYMCELAEKLETPEVESPPHIQEAYEMLLELTEKALETSDTPTELIAEVVEAFQTDDSETTDLIDEAIGSPALSSPNTSTPSAAHQPKLPAVTRLLVYMKVLSSQNIPDSMPNTPYTSSGIAGTPIGTNSNPSFSRPSTINPEVTSSKIHDASEYHQTTQSRATLPLASVALASVAATNLHKTPEISHRYQLPPSLPIEERYTPTSPSVSHFDQKPSVETGPIPPSRRQNDIVRASFEHNPTVHTPEAAPQASKLEHLPLLSLLALAKNVHVGHGRYLKDEFEHGRIDKAGLIKVLKSKKKGLDFSREFTHQAANFRERLASIEFITKPPKSTISHDSHTETNVQTPAAESPDTTTKKEDFTHTILERYAHPEKSLFQPSHKSPIPITLIVTILGIITFGTLILFLLLPS